MYLLLAFIMALVVWFGFLKKEAPPPLPIPSGYFTEPPIVTDRTVRPRDKTPYPSSVTRVVNSSER
jgi:hypothetical protein